MSQPAFRIGGKGAFEMGSKLSLRPCRFHRGCEEFTRRHLKIGREALRPMSDILMLTRFGTTQLSALDTAKLNSI